MMTQTDPRTAILARIADERRRWRDLVETVGADRMTEPGPMGEWSFKDLASHLLGWRERTIDRLEAAAAGRQEPPPPWPAELDDDDAINDWIRDRHLDRPVDAVLADVDASYGRLAAAVAALPPDLVVRRDAFRWLEGESLLDTDLFSHLHEEHEPSIREWLAGGR